MSDRDDLGDRLDAVEEDFDDDGDPLEVVIRRDRVDEDGEIVETNETVVEL